MPEPLTQADLNALGQFDTPTICNLIEMVAPERRGFGYTVRQLNCVFPELPPMVGYARTCTIRAKEPAAYSGEEYLNVRFNYIDYVASGPAPRVSVVQDLDDGQPGYGSFWGEVNSNVHKALGCLGTVTNGSVRDLDMIAEGFQLIAGVIAPSHAFVHIVDFDRQVNVHGMTVNSGDVVHADRHGAVAMPVEVAREVPNAADLLHRREAVILDAARAPEPTVEKLKQAFADSANIKS